MGHETGAKVECLINAIWLIKHLHDIVMVDARWFLDFDALLCHGFNLVMLDFVVQGELYNLSIVDVVVALGVILEDCRVTGNDLELMGLIFVRSR